MVQRLQVRLDKDKDSTAPPGAIATPDRADGPAAPPPARRPDVGTDTKPKMRAPKLDELRPEPERPLQPVSPALMADGGPRPGLVATARFRRDDTLPPGARARRTEGGPEAGPARDVFRGLEKGLMEVDFSGRVYIKQGTIYSYSGNLTFWVKENRPGGRPALVIVTGAGRLILTDQDREITFMQVADEPVFVEPTHLLACEEGLEPRYVRLGGEQSGLDVIALQGRGMLALSVASKPLPLTVKPDLPVSVPAHSVIMWTGELMPHVVDDPQVYAVVLPSSVSSGRLFRLEGTGRILVEQAAG
jgi:uncharacterized protein (AIM24 family)